MSSKEIKAIATQEAPSAIGPYSQAIRAGDMLYLSGQIPLDPTSMQMVGNSVEDQTRQVMKNLTGVLAAENLSLKNIVKTTVYLASMNDFPKFNAVYQEFLSPPYPARATIEVSKLPKDALVEIEAVAYYSKND